MYYCYFEHSNTKVDLVSCAQNTYVCFSIMRCCVWEQLYQFGMHLLVIKKCRFLLTLFSNFHNFQGIYLYSVYQTSTHKLPVQNLNLTRMIICPVVIRKLVKNQSIVFTTIFPPIKPLFEKNVYVYNYHNICFN